MIASTTPGTHNPRISAQTVTNRLREIGERPPYTMYVLYAAFLFWPSIYKAVILLFIGCCYSLCAAVLCVCSPLSLFFVSIISLRKRYKVASLLLYSCFYAYAFLCLCYIVSSSRYHGLVSDM